MNTDKADEGPMTHNFHPEIPETFATIGRLNILKTMRITSRKIHIKYRGKLSEL